MNYAITEEFLRIDRDVYRLDNIQSINIARHNQTEQIVRQCWLGILFALLGSTFFVWLGPGVALIATFCFVAGVLYGIATCNITELRAQCVEPQEGTRHGAILYKAYNDDQLEGLMAIFIDLNRRLQSR